MAELSLYFVVERLPGVEVAYAGETRRNWPWSLISEYFSRSMPLFSLIA